MIDNIAIINIVLRSVALFFLFRVLYNQVRLLKPSTGLQWLKWLLIAMVVIIITGNILSLVINLFRNDDGNLKTHVRHIAMVFNGTAVLATSVLLDVIYRRKD